MEPEEIAVVLARASELHSKLIDAIGSVAEDASSSAGKDLQNGDSTAEVRSLAAIRDALEVLEEQLESLQALQQQQRAERDAGLTEIEESRRVFLKRLKDHRGRELEIVQEAFAFAGGSVPDKDDSPPPHYPTINDDESSQLPLVSIPSRRSRPGQRQDMIEEQQDRSEVFDFEVEEDQEDDEGNEGDLAFQYEDDKDPNSLIGAAVNAANAMKNSVKNSGAFACALNAVKSSVALLGQLVGKITGQVTGPSSKVVLIVVSTLAVLSLTDLGEKRTKSVSRVSRTPAHRSHHHHISDLIAENSSKQSGQADSGKSHGGCCGHNTKEEPLRAPAPEKPLVWDENSITGNPVKKLEDDFPKCVVRERLELPFYQELQTPDVLYGRG